MQEIINSKKFKIALIIVGSVIMALVIFVAGINVGFHKAKFSCKWGENYERNFMGPRPGMMGPGGPMEMMGEKFRDFEGKGMRNGHGVAGTIISISDNSIVIKDRDGKENNVTVDDKTTIKRGRDDIKTSDLKNDEEIVVIGRPGDSGVIEADLIRVFDKNDN